MSDFSMTVNRHDVCDEVSVFETSGGKIGLTIEDSTGRYAATFLTPDEWDVIRQQGERLADQLRAPAPSPEPARDGAEGPDPGS